MIPKFRAWHKEFKQMRDIQELRLDYLPEGNVLACVGNKDIPHRFDIVWPFSEIELMQWTGLQDKNGCDIYDGDIVKDFLGNSFIVRWIASDARFGWFQTSSKLECVFKFFDENLRKYNVIGNIYELKQ